MKPLGHPAYLKAKANGNHSMPGKRETLEDVYDVVPQDPRDMARAKLLEPQFPAMQRNVHRLPRLGRCHPDRTTPHMSSQASAGWAVGNDPTQGNERGAYVALLRLAFREYRIACGARALWRQSPHSSPSRGKPGTWRRGAGVFDDQPGRYA
jgi:hypothetical protein